MKTWTQTTYRRYSVDIHVPDWHPDLLGKFNAAEYVGNIAKGGFQSMVHYANSHAGLALWKTRVGQPHRNMGGHDWFSEVVGECRKSGIVPLAYFSVGHDNWACEKHPDWRLVYSDGGKYVTESRYGACCFNAPGYRDYVTACIREIVGNYDIDGMFFDMTFWSGGTIPSCYCPHCTARFWKEAGQEPPRIFDMTDPAWRAWQQARERSIMDFAHLCTNTVKSVKPHLVVHHQFSTALLPWQAGVSLELTQACDFVGGDFYGGSHQHSLACKLFDSLTRSRPFEFHTSRTRVYTDHVTVKPVEELRTEAAVASLHHAALMLVDYINPDGTLNGEVYEFLGRYNAERARYEPYYGGHMLADVAIYYDKNSVYDPACNGHDLSKPLPPGVYSHRDAVGKWARVLQQAHVPFGVVTNITLDQLPRYRAVIVPEVLEMTPAQAGIFRRFVEEGGVLLATGRSGLDPLAPGNEPRNFLEEILGVRPTSKMSFTDVYVTPCDKALQAAIWPQDHVSTAWSLRYHEVVAPGAQVLATLTEPFVDPKVGRAIGSRFAAIHSNPPALQPGTAPAIVLNAVGRGKTVWLAAPLELRDERVNAGVLMHLLKRVLPPPFCFELEAHPAVEMTLYDQPERQRMIVALANLQPMTQVPVPATVRVAVPEGRTIKTIERVPDGKAIPFERTGPYVQFQVEPFSPLAMFALT